MKKTLVLLFMVFVVSGCNIVMPAATQTIKMNNSTMKGAEL